MRQSRFDLLHGLRRRRLDACRTQLAAVRRFGDDLENQLSETVRAAGSVVAEQRLAIGPGELVIERMSDCRRRRAELQQAERMLFRRRDLVEAVDGSRVVAVSVVPVCSDSIRALGLTVVVEPERARLVAMLNALAEVARTRSGS